MPNPDSKPKQPKHFHISSKEREYFIENLAMLTKAAVPLGSAFTSIGATTRSVNFKKALEQIKGDIEEGMSLFKALERSGIVSSQTLALIRLGEQSGNLVENLKVAANQEAKQRVFRSKIMSALLYPGFVLGLTVVVGLGISWFLLPRLAVTFTQLKIKLPLISRIFINLGLFLKDNGLWFIPALFALMIVVAYIIFFAPKTKSIGQALLFHTPGVSRLLHEVEIARFGYLLGTLLQAGLTVTESIKLLSQSTTIPHYQALYAYLNKSIEDGFSFEASLAKYPHINKLLYPAVQQMVVAGEKSGSLPETLLQLGLNYEQKADITTQNLEVILEPILLVFVWLGVLGVAVAVILPIYSLVGGLSK